MNSQNFYQTTANPNSNLKDLAVINMDPSNVNSLYYLDKSLNSITVLVMEMLNEDNYYTWAKSMERVLSIQNKRRFIDETLTQFINPTDPLRTWCNDIVIIWI